MHTVLRSAQDNTSFFLLVLRENCLNNFFTSHFFLPSSNSTYLAPSPFVMQILFHFGNLILPVIVWFPRLKSFSPKKSFFFCLNTLEKNKIYRNSITRIENRSIESTLHREHPFQYEEFDEM